MDKVFAGDLRSLWANYRMLPTRLFPWTDGAFFGGILRDPIAKVKELLHDYKVFFGYYKKYRRSKTDRLIIKFIRANLMLGWLAKNYNAKIVLLVRHPAAVVSSRLRLIESTPQHTWSFDNLFRQYTTDTRLAEDYLHKYNSVLRGPLTPTSALTVIWCIENVLPIVKAQKHGHYVAFYEDLILDPNTYWNQLLQYLGFNAVPNSKILSKPSQQASMDMKESGLNDRQFTKWTTYLNQKQVTEIETVLKAFQVNIYSAFETVPVSRIQSDTYLH